MATHKSRKAMMGTIGIPEREQYLFLVLIVNWLLAVAYRVVFHAYRIASNFR